MVDETAEDFQRLGAFDERALNGVTRFCPRYDEPRSTLHTSSQTVAQALLDALRMSACVQASVEEGAIETERARVLTELRRRKRLLILEEPVVHLPIFALIASAVGGLRGLAGLRMDLIQRVVAKHVAHLARVNVVPFERWQCRRIEPPAERALVVEKSKDLHRRACQPNGCGTCTPGAAAPPSGAAPL